MSAVLCGVLTDEHMIPQAVAASAEEEGEEEEDKAPVRPSAHKLWPNELPPFSSSLLKR